MCKKGTRNERHSKQKKEAGISDFTEANIRKHAQTADSADGTVDVHFPRTSGGVGNEQERSFFADEPRERGAVCIKH